MLKLNSSKDDLKECLNLFVWTFKIGDNIFYNLDVIFQLIDDHNNLDQRNYAKPVSILCISVIEAILVDFLERLDSATVHFPSKLDSKRKEIKAELKTQKTTLQTTYKGKTYLYKRLRNFGYKELIEFCEKFNILGSSYDTYEVLQNFGRYRNRVHIHNYFGNFERDESRAFSENRTQKAIDYMERILSYFSKNYSRP